MTSLITKIPKGHHYNSSNDDPGMKVQIPSFIKGLGLPLIMQAGFVGSQLGPCTGRYSWIPLKTDIRSGILPGIPSGFDGISQEIPDSKSFGDLVGYHLGRNLGLIFPWVSTVLLMAPTGVLLL